MFEPFFTTKPTGQGSGLGLSQVYGFVKQSNGHVKIYSEPGAGTTVKIYLPRTMEPEASATPQSAQPIPQGNGDTVMLVVEDDPNVRSLTVDMLRRFDYQVVDASDAAAALHILDTRRTSRWCSPMSGCRASTTVANWPMRRSNEGLVLKVLFTTGYARNAIVHHGRLDPGLELIVKPFSYAALAAKLKTILEGK